MWLRLCGNQIGMVRAIKTHMQGHALPEIKQKPDWSRSFVIADPYGTNQLSRMQFSICLFVFLKSYIFLNYRESWGKQSSQTYKKQEWPRYAESTSAFIWSFCVFRKHRPSLSVMTVYIFSMCGSRGNWTSNLGSISTVFTHRVTPHLCIKNVLWVLWSYKEIIVCFCYHAGNFATTESLLCLSYSSKYFSFLFPVKSVLKSKKEEISPLGSTMAKRPSGPLEVGTPFYQDGQLQVRVYWKNRGGMHSDVLIYSFVRIQLAPHYVHQSL